MGREELGGKGGVWREGRDYDRREGLGKREGLGGKEVIWREGMG